MDQPKFPLPQVKPSESKETQNTDPCFSTLYHKAININDIVREFEVSVGGTKQ